ncbi:hypothetical protein AWL63_10155 [Sphingomonas panacis]|uniref:Uncharacterized protein n=1 Tax=Sphingomonas panacis TaxID=1560345 RepID=A0A1B3ZA32_9SPHN|nr:hypothetical protein AWL63_10155 [Sphingomonas panacis]
MISLGLMQRRIAHPVVDGRLPPTCTAQRDTDLLGERTSLYFSIQRCPAEAGAIEHGFKAEDAVGWVGFHGMIPVRV